ncbi:Uncharacterised protein [Mycobacteroides abscessus subsp. abscessus]|nr:Uncharacterised protein [Mycobacteroides abscessus subsp. abscessus]
MAMAVISSPEQNLGSQRCFCSSLDSSSRYGAITSLCSEKPRPEYCPLTVSSVITAL